MEIPNLILLYDYYGDLLTDRQRECFELRYNQDLSLGEIGQELGISRQGVHDNLVRTEALLKNMESKTGCVRRDMECRKVMLALQASAQMLLDSTDPRAVDFARQIMDAARKLEE